MKQFFTPLILLAWLYLPFGLKAQTSDENWIVAAEQEGITLSYQAAPCGNHTMLLLKVENHHAKSAVISLSLEKQENGQKRGVPSFRVQVAAEESKIIDCQQFGPYGIVPMVVKDKKELSVTIYNLHVQLL